MMKSGHRIVKWWIPRNTDSNFVPFTCTTLSSILIAYITIKYNLHRMKENQICWLAESRAFYTCFFQTF